MRKGPPEISVSILRILLNNDIKVCNSCLVILTHLQRFGSLVVELHLRGRQVYRLRKWEYCLMKLLDQAVAQSYPVIQVRLI